MSYRKRISQQYLLERKTSKAEYTYARKKPHGWVLGYERKGKYAVAYRNRVPKSAEFVDLVVPARKELQLPVDAEIVLPHGKDGRLIVRVPRERLWDIDVEGVLAEPEAAELQPKASRAVTEYDQQIAAIRKALKELCPTLSVRRGSGTAYSWIEISGSKEYGEFTGEEKRALEKFGLSYGGNLAVISPEDRSYYAEKARKMLQ